MKIMRSMFFGCIAMLAAVFCYSAPSMAMSIGVSVYSIGTTDYDLDVPVLVKFDAVEVRVAAESGRSTNFHAAAYTVQNQPHSLFRQNVEAYSHINPHIA